MDLHHIDAGKRHASQCDRPICEHDVGKSVLLWETIGPFVGLDYEIGPFVRIGQVVGIGLFGGTGLVVSLTYVRCLSCPFGRLRVGSLSFFFSIYRVYNSLTISALPCYKE